MVEFVRIVNEKKPGEFLVLAKDEFDPEVHTLFDERASAKPPETNSPKPPKRPRRSTK